MAEFDTIRTVAGARSAEIDEGLRAHMNKVYGTMSVGMLITALAAWAISGLAVTDVPNGYQIGTGTYLTDFGVTIYTSALRWVIMLAPLAFVFGLSAMINKMSAATAQLVFYAFAATMGLSLSSIFLVYTSTSITQVFLITAIAFAGLSLYGYTTKKDLSAMGT
ncbi:MAG: FtsH-binding integral membrane protein, partial [Paracoccaceae bacterium]